MMGKWRVAGACLAVLLGSGGIVACSSRTESVQEGPAAVAETPPAPASIYCEVAIIGGGAGGLHTAFRLAPTLGSRVCLFEKDAQLGGRIFDVAKDDGDPNSPRIGAGARRVMASQEVLVNLASELELELEKPEEEADLINARHSFSFSKDTLQQNAYPNIPAVSEAGKDQETFLYDLLRKGPERANISKYADLRSYIQHVAGDEQLAFLRDMSRFRADFDYPLDARGYMDYLDEEWDTVTPSYPKGGMSSFIRGMESRATRNGARIFTSEPVSEIEKRDGQYHLKTSKQDVRAGSVVIAVPPVGLDKISGDVAARIKAQAEYQQIIGVRVVTIAQFWPEAWWTEIKNPSAAANNKVWRAWSTEHCFNFIEIPIEPYAAAQKVTRSVYVDDLRCVTFWEDLAKTSTAAVEAEIQRGLEYMFNGNGVSSPAQVTIPKPLKTHFQVWPAAWHWLRAGATVTNASLTDWAVEPLKGERVALVGEAYNPQRSGWSDAAYKSSIKLLHAKYGVTAPGLPPAAPSARARGTDERFTPNAAGRSVRGGVSLR